MPSFTVQLTREGFYGASALTTPEDLIITPQTWSASDRGGMKEASLTATGSAESLASLSGRLGDRIEIYNEQGDCVWWGLLWNVEITLGNIVLNASLNDIYNRVAVIYPFQLPDGSEESRTTDWAEDAVSIARYGVRELLYGASVAFSRSPVYVRDNKLARSKTASPAISTQSGADSGATLTARGMWQRAASVYFTNPDGLEEHADGSARQTIGEYYLSTGISFGAATPGGETDEFFDASGTFGGLVVNDPFTVSGAVNSANNKNYTVVGKDAPDQISVSGSLVSEAAGATIKISRGAIISMSNVAQSFQLDSSWVCTHVAVKVRRIGSPSDSFRIGIYPDASGVPGTVLTANETLGSALFSELTWTEFAFATPVLLSAATTYYVNMRRTGSASLDDGYEVAVDEGLGYAGGSLIVYDGSAWVARAPDADLAFRVIGEISSTEQLGKAIGEVTDFAGSLIQVDSEVPVRQFSEDERTALDAMEELLDAGMSTGERLTAWVTREGVVVIATADTLGYGESRLILGKDSRLRYFNGSFVSPGKLIFGTEIDMESLLLLDGFSVRASGGTSVYVQSSSYDAESDTISIESEGASDPFATFATRQG